ncbi:MAG: AgmX/PglI C-terminal domain-containing protein [Rhodobacterales bacterium]|nr:AgmX/PglI C-terminal domain-containing protein [Rhodobacterales bacterium]
MGGSLGTGAGPNSEPNFAPLIDVVLVILIIMMVNIPIQIEEMGVKLPSSEQSTSKPPPEAQEQLVIAIYDNSEGENAEEEPVRLALNRKRMTEEYLFNEITRRLRPMTDKNVFIDADAEVMYGHIVDMVDLAREAGAGKVGLARMKDSGPLDITSVAPGAMPKGVYLGQPKVVGGLSEKDADGAIKPLMPSITQCYNARLAAAPGLSGRITIRTVIGPQGEHMEPPSVQAGTIEDESLIECVTGLLPNIKYPVLGADKTAIANFPIMFSAG